MPEAPRAGGLFWQGGGSVLGSTSNMRYHDFHLDGYTVRDSGGNLVLHLSLDSEHDGRVESRIEFTGVSVYHFVHTGGAILTEIVEMPVRELVKQEQAFLSEAAHKLGLRNWNQDLADFITCLEQQGLRAWGIGSAIGFEGFVVARAVSGTEKVGEAP